MLPRGQTIYRSALISRRAGLTEEEFRQHWIRIHGGLSAKMPGVGTYRQNHIVERFYEKLETPLQAVDGISQLSFENIAAMGASDASLEYAAVKADIPNFQGGITILVLQAEELVPLQQTAGAAKAKLLWLSNRRGNLGGSELRRQWAQGKRESLASVPGLRGFVQNFVIDRAHPVHAGVPAGDAGTVESITEMWFDDVEALKHALTTEAGHRCIYEDPYLRAMAVYRIDEIHII